jgi:anti-sigma B factor antagonist
LATESQGNTGSGNAAPGSSAAFRFKRGGKAMAISVRKHDVNSVTVLDLSGRIDLGEGSVTLRDTVRKLLEEGRKKIVLNLAGVSYIDSSGLGELIAAYVTANNRGATLKLLNLTKRVDDLMQITKLATVFDVYDDEQAAIKSFAV